MFKKIVNFLGGDPNKREVERLAARAEQINALEPAFEKLSNDELKAKTAEFKSRLANGETLDDILEEAFATVREASKRTIGLRPYDVQLIGGMVLDNKTIAEMRTGEGKTLVATLPAYLNALTGRGVHIVTVNDYLARRDARWMAPIYNFLGISVGVLQMAARTENGRKAFIVNLENTSPIEDQDQLDLVDRKQTYLADIIYGTNSEFGFDYLRDNLTNRLEERSQRGHYYAIVDEVDNILIDEARTPLIISGPASDDTELYLKLAGVVRALNAEDYEVNERDRTVTMTEVGQMHVEDMLQMSLGDPDRPEDINPEQSRILGHLEQALKAQFLYHKNKDYLVQAGKVVIIDEFTGRLMPGRRWSEGLHQAVEAKENVKVEAENITYATITIQNYFRMYEKLAGMTGTALTEAEEFDKIYKLQVLPIPTNLEYNAIRPNPTLVEVTDKDEDGYKVTYYTRRDDSSRRPVFWRRKDYPDVIYRTIETKLRAITQEILHYNVVGRPLLVGTTSVEHSELLSARLQTEGVRRLAQAMLIRDAYLTKHNKHDSETSIPELKFLYNPVDKLNVSELRQFAREVDMNSVNPEDPENIGRLLRLLNLSPADQPRMEAVLKGGVPHEVLNARKHDTESQIIAGAGAFGAVTIATNMAGRGVDIKLGGELDEETLNSVSRVLRKPGVDPYDMTNQQKREALRKMNPDDYELYKEDVQTFLTHMDNMDKVRELGGLHVIGSERHEARRIDNQLRGRAARQGDPGSSRFYLSLEDDLMRLFGGSQAEGLLSRFNIEESLPIENAMVARLVEQSQTRVEGNNFDVRKHLLEYDDVLNMQRKRIYEQRDRVFTKEDLSDDVNEMLEIEVKNRMEAVGSDAEGYWKLLAYLEEIQPPITLDDQTYPSYTTALLADHIRKEAGEQPTPESLRKSLLDVAFNSLEAEREYLRNNVASMLESASTSMDLAQAERDDFLDTFFQGLPDRLEEDPAVRPQQLAEEINAGLRLPLRLSNDDLRKLTANDDSLLQKLKAQVQSILKNITLNRAIGALQRRLPDLTIDTSRLAEKDWGDSAEDLSIQTDTYLKKRTEQLSAQNGPIDRDLQLAIEKIPELLDLNPQSITRLLAVMTEGTRLSFDRKTHQRGQEKYQRLVPFFYGTQLLEDQASEQLIEEITNHLRGAQEAQKILFGRFELYRLGAANVTLNQLLPALKDKVAEILGLSSEKMQELTISSLSDEDRSKLEEPLGARLQNEVYRDVLLNSISNLWVEHLTKVDALRVSIGLEAYAQRDPLVAYKAKATEMFHDLLNDIRSAVVSRILTFQPVRRAPVESVQTQTHHAEAAEEPTSTQPQNASGGGRKRKRKRK